MSILKKLCGILLMVIGCAWWLLDYALLKTVLTISNWIIEVIGATGIAVIGTSVMCVFLSFTLLGSVFIIGLYTFIIGLNILLE